MKIGSEIGSRMKLSTIDPRCVKTYSSKLIMRPQGLRALKLSEIVTLIFELLRIIKEKFHLKFHLKGWLIHTVNIIKFSKKCTTQNNLSYDEYFVYASRYNGTLAMIRWPTVDIVTNKLYGNKRKVNGITKSDFKKLLQLSAEEKVFSFNGNYHRQKDGGSLWDHHWVQP